MKPDGVETTSMEPVEAVAAEPAVEGTVMGEPHPASRSDETEKDKEENEKPDDATTKAKVPNKTKPVPVGTKTKPTGAASRPGATQNGAQKRVANGVAKKTNAVVAERNKPPAATGPAKRPTVPVSSAKPPAKVAEKKLLGTSKPSAPPAGANKKPVSGAGDAAKAKQKPTASRSASAPSTKPNSSAAAKPDKPIASKTTRPAGGPSAPRPASTTSAAKPATSTARPTLKAGATTAPPAVRTATVQAVKPSVPEKKDVRLTTAPVKKAVPPLSRPPSLKTSKSEAPKANATGKVDPIPKRTMANNKHADVKPPRPKPGDAKPVPSREINASPRAVGTRPGLSKAPIPKKPLGNNATVLAKRGPKPVSAQPVKKSPAEEPSSDVTTAPAPVAEMPHDLPAAQEVTIVPVVSKEESSVAPSQTVEVNVEGERSVSNTESDVTVVAALSNIDNISTSPLQDQALTEIPDRVFNVEPERPIQEVEQFPSESTSEVIMPNAESLEMISAEEQKNVENLTENKSIINAEVQAPIEAASPVSLLVPEVEEALEKADSELNEDNDFVEEEEEKEGSQQVSVSEMSGTQPTEESRPGSAGLPGSIWRGGALLSELDSEDVSCSQQGASELSAPGVHEGTESIDDLGDASLKGADGEGASAGSPDLEIVPDIPTNEEDEEEDDDEEEDHVCDMEVGSEQAEDSRRLCHEGEDEEEDEDVEMASEGVTESGLESYGNADEDDFAEDDRSDNLNRVQPCILLPSLPAASWVQTNPFAQPPQPSATLRGSPSSDHYTPDPETPIQAPAEAWLELSTAMLIPEVEQPSKPQSEPHHHLGNLESSLPVESTLPLPVRGMSQSSTLSGPELAAQSSSETSTPEELRDYSSSSEDKLQTPVPQLPDPEQDLGIHLEREGEEEEAETLPADEVLGGPATAPTSNPSSPSISGDEASDTEGETALSELDGKDVRSLTFVSKPAAQTLQVLEEHGEIEEDGDTPQSANSVASYGFDCTTSNSNAQSTQSPGIFSLENEDQLLEEAKDSLINELILPDSAPEMLPSDPVDLQPLAKLEEVQPSQEEQQYMLCGKLGVEQPDLCATVEADFRGPALLVSPNNLMEDPDAQPPYYSTISEKTDSFLAGECERSRWQGSCLLEQQLPQQNKHQEVMDVQDDPFQAQVVHQTQLRQSSSLPPTMQLCQLGRQEQVEPKEQLQTQEACDEEEEKLRQKQQRQLEQQRQELLQLQLQHQQQELKQRQQILQWQQELAKQQQPQKNQSTILLSPTSGLCTIYEAIDGMEEEEERKSIEIEKVKQQCEGFGFQQENVNDYHSNDDLILDKRQPFSPPIDASNGKMEFDWGQKVDIVQKLINQTLLLAGDGCSPLLLLPGGGGGTLSPLEASMWPSLLPPLTPPSATVTSVSSFSPEDQGSSPQGEWTVVELETHH